MRLKNKFQIILSLFLVLAILGIGNLNHNNFVLAITKFPSPRYGHDMVYDSKNNQTILFGGRNPNTLFNKMKSTWIYSSISQSWEEISDSISPGARINHQMVYNSISGKVFLFGGMEISDYTKLDDTWEFDPESNKWTNLQPENSPSARHSQAMYFDPVFNVVVSFGGYLENDQLSSETWIFNYTTNNWYQINPVIHPTTRYGHSFVYDEAQQIGIFFGGRHLGLMDETWFFNLSSVTWTQMSPIHSPLRRYWFDMIYNSFEKNIILFGGDNEESPLRALDDTWIFTSADVKWTNIEPAVKPTPRNNHAMVFDKYLNKTILFGGYGEEYTKVYNDLWMFDSTDLNWTQISATTSNVWRIVIFYVLGPLILIGTVIFVVIFLRRKKFRKKTK